MAGRGRTYMFNAFETVVVGDFSEAASVLRLATVKGLRVPGYLVIEPEDPQKREYILYTAITNNDLTVTERDLAGSVDQTQRHPDGVTVRSVSMHQHYDDIWEEFIVRKAVMDNHVDDTDDPHHNAGYLKKAGPGGGDSLYLPLDGSMPMANELRLANSTPSLDVAATSKKYVADTYLPLIGGIVTGSIHFNDVTAMVLGNQGAPQLRFMKAANGEFQMYIAGGPDDGTDFMLHVFGNNSDALHLKLDASLIIDD